MSERIDGPYSPIALPSLPLEDWKDTKETLHRYAQIVGKVRLECSPHRNHWWNVPLYVTSRGLTTGPNPYGDETFEISFDFIADELQIVARKGRKRIEPVGIERAVNVRFGDQRRADHRAHSL